MNNFRFNYRLIASYPAPARLGIFMGLLLCLWLPLAAPLAVFLAADPNLLSIVAMGLLFCQFLWFLTKWRERLYRQRGLGSYGLVWSRQTAQELLLGLDLGLGAVWLLFGVQAVLGWVRFAPATADLGRVIWQGSLTGLGVALAEELFFRGWLLTELEQDYAPRVALIANACLFAGLHFLKPWSEIVRTFPQLPALVILGLTLVWAKRAYHHRLGICIGLHGGLVWGYYQLNVGKLVVYTGGVSPWLTGVDRNPLAGLMGILFLLALAVWMQQKASRC